MTAKKSDAKKSDDAKPVWDVATHGPPPEGREDQYEVINGG